MVILSDMFSLASLDPDMQDRIESITMAYISDLQANLEEMKVYLSMTQVKELALESIEDTESWEIVTTPPLVDNITLGDEPRGE